MNDDRIATILDACNTERRARRASRFLAFLSDTTGRNVETLDALCSALWAQAEAIGYEAAGCLRLAIKHAAARDQYLAVATTNVQLAA